MVPQVGFAILCSGLNEQCPYRRVNWQLIVPLPKCQCMMNAKQPDPFESFAPDPAVLEVNHLSHSISLIHLFLLNFRPAIEIDSD